MATVSFDSPISLLKIGYTESFLVRYFGCEGYNRSRSTLSWQGVKDAEESDLMATQRSAFPLISRGLRRWGTPRVRFGFDLGSFCET